jgi:hypothetical protein
MSSGFRVSDTRGGPAQDSIFQREFYYFNIH